MCALTAHAVLAQPRRLALARRATCSRARAELVSAPGARSSRGAVSLEVGEQVDAVEQRSAQAAAVARQLRFAAAAAFAVAGIAARARVGGGDEHEAGGVDRRVARP